MSNETQDNPGVVAPPPLIYLSALIIGLALNFLFSMPIPIARMWVVIVGLALIALAGIIVSLAFRAMRNARTNINPALPTNNIVTKGVFAYSRNPIYLSLTLLFIGVSLLTNSLWMLILLAPVLFLMHFGVIFREERYLENKFGDEYLNYKSHVRRWI